MTLGTLTRGLSNFGALFVGDRSEASAAPRSEAPEAAVVAAGARNLEGGELVSTAKLDLDRAEQSLNELIEKRAQEAEDANAAVEEERRRAQRFLSRYEREYRQAWADYYRTRVALFEDLAEENRQKLTRLVDGVA